ncbi:MAG: hypothetical protein IRZ26_03045 [Clostridia bacterium]|nr:hypothetical protein [Clostridia bacterium]
MTWGSTMKPTVRKIREGLAALRRATRPTTGLELLLDSALAGALLGVLAQFLRQVPGALMSLGASTAPWVMIGFLLAVSASRDARAPRDAILVGTGTVAAYLFAWLVLYHLLFVLRESVSFAAGWREAAPWLVAAVPASPILGAVAALSHRRGPLGDACLAAPVAWSLPEALEILREGGSDAAAVLIPVAVLAALLIRMVAGERRVRAITLLGAAATLAALTVAVFPVVRNLIRS